MVLRLGVVCLLGFAAGSKLLQWVLLGAECPSEDELGARLAQGPVELPIPLTTMAQLKRMKAKV